MTLFTCYEKEAYNILEKKRAYPAYDYCLKCSHTFNLLDARGAISVTERMNFIQRIRKIARKCAVVYVATVYGELEPKNSAKKEVSTS